ncbi:hypothetical protein DFJ43DRAFT_1161578 [Lentinula guzmanii]|uniref:Uncharacterized protein n=1 Tax=Lentinula guzmanii TaxID=2804957 RepID=A0AA38J8J8_9AGAR|nr:hypothetical protein DFJ43DRAFT_1161578 [Lentinula guzmanii]
MRFPLLLNFWTACLVIGLISVVCAAPRPVDNAIAASLSDDQSLPASSPYSSNIEVQPRATRYILASIDVRFPYTYEGSMTEDEDTRAQAVIRALIKKAAEPLDIKVTKHPADERLRLMSMPEFRFHNYPGHWTSNMVLEARLLGPEICRQRDLRQPQDCTLHASEVSGSPGYFDMEILNGAGYSMVSIKRVWVKSEARLYEEMQQNRQKQELKDRFNRLPHY